MHVQARSIHELGVVIATSVGQEADPIDDERGRRQRALTAAPFAAAVATSGSWTGHDDRGDARR